MEDSSPLLAGVVVRGCVSGYVWFYLKEPSARTPRVLVKTMAANSDWLQIARVLRPHTAQVNSLDFTKDGDYLLSSGDDARIALHSTMHGITQRIASCAAQGATLARFTHDPLSVIHASPVDHTVRYLSLHDNRFLRAFRAHAEPITALEMSPRD